MGDSLDRRGAYCNVAEAYDLAIESGHPFAIALSLCVFGKVTLDLSSPEERAPAHADAVPNFWRTATRYLRTAIEISQEGCYHLLAGQIKLTLAHELWPICDGEALSLWQMASEDVSRVTPQYRPLLTVYHGTEEICSLTRVSKIPTLRIENQIERISALEGFCRENHRLIRDSHWASRAFARLAELRVELDKDSELKEALIDYALARDLAGGDGDRWARSWGSNPYSIHALLSQHFGRAASLTTQCALIRRNSSRYSNISRSYLFA